MFNFVHEPHPDTCKLQELHSSLAWIYKTHASKIDTIWRSFDRNQRAKCFVSSSKGRAVLRHSLDTSLGQECEVFPELNLYDISTEPDFLLWHLKHRVTTSLFEQYCDDANGRPGDRNIVVQMMEKNNIWPDESYRYCYTVFQEDRYADCFEIVTQHEETLAALAPVIQAGLCVPRTTGIFIFDRQLMLLRTFHTMVEYILDISSQTQSLEGQSEKPGQAASAALPKLTIQELPKKFSLHDLISSAQDQKDSLEEYLTALSAEPTIFVHTVNVWLFSRPELVMDYNGRHLPFHTDKYISGSLFEAVHSTIKRATIWSYIFRLLELLEDSPADAVYRRMITQEISNVCHLEYSRAQAHLVRHVQTGIGARYFKRAANTYGIAGNIKVGMTIKQPELDKVDPQLHYVLRLCQPPTNARRAVEWIKKLSDLYMSRPIERETLQEREIDALGDLIVITTFIQELSTVISIPALSRKQGQIFVSGCEEVYSELNKLRHKIDLQDYAVPIDKLLEPGMANGALTTLDQFIVSKTGSKMGFLYQDLVEDCLADLQTQCQEIKAKIEKTEYVPLPVTVSRSLEERVARRKHKEKTRPSQSPILEIVPAPKVPDEEPVQPLQVFKVSPPVGEVFSTLFNVSETRASVSWTAFVAAMAELGFFIVTKHDFVYTFSPTYNMTLKKSFTVCRPYKSRIGGYLIPIFARRLKRAYGWGEKTFKTV